LYDVKPHERDFTLLQDYSLIAVNLDGKFFEMHRLVQFAIQHWLQDQKDQTRRWQRHFVGIMLNAFPEHHDIQEKGNVCQTLLPHAMMAIALPLRAAESPLLEQQSRLTVRCAHHAWFMGAYAESERLAGKALVASEQSLGTDHITTIEAMARMAHAQVKLRKFDEAEKSQLRIVDRHKSILGEEHNKTLDAMADLGWTYHHQGRSEEGKTLQEQALSAMRKTLPDSDRVVLSTMNNLAATYSELDQLSEAEKLQQAVVSTCKTEFDAQNGTQHSDTLASMYVLAQIYKRQECWSKTEKLAREVLEGTKTALGENHVDTIKTMMLLATALRPLGRRKSALLMLRSCVDKSTSVLGAGDPVTARRHQLLEAWCCEDEGAPEYDGTA
jgi:tetratricopeptide (TPR) repeat protein